MRGQPGFFDVDDRLKRLSDLGDQLEACQAAMDFETFHPQLNDPPSKWWTPLISSIGAGKVFNGYVASSIYG